MWYTKKIERNKWIVTPKCNFSCKKVAFSAINPAYIAIHSFSETVLISSYPDYTAL